MSCKHSLAQRSKMHCGQYGCESPTVLLIFCVFLVPSSVVFNTWILFVIVLLKINVFNCNKIVGVVSPIKYKQPEARVVCLNEVNVNFANQAKYLCLHDSLKDDNGTQKQVKPFYCAEMACLISAPLQLKNSILCFISCLLHANVYLSKVVQAGL